jgi:YfiH family protein
MNRVPQVPLIEALKLARWSPGSDTSVLLSSLGISHGVLGRSAPEFRLSELLPHHVTQVHGNEIVKASKKTAHESDERPAGDGIYSDDGIAVAIKTADCLPVLLATQDGQWVAAIHAGWRGFTKGIILNALRTARVQNPGKNLVAVIGPSISRERFEVGPEVVDALFDSSCELSEVSVHLCTSKGARDRWHIDLSLAAACQMILAGVDPSAIEVLQSCTVTEHSGQHPRWHSYRRDGKPCGSNWTWIRSI